VGSEMCIRDRGTSHVEDRITDERDAQHLYEALEEEVVPLYYDRDKDGLPRAWINRMCNSISTLAWRFSSHRMVMDYARVAYVPASGGVSCSF
jgi:starch phosphorylase